MREHENRKIKEAVRDETMPEIMARLPLFIRIQLRWFSKRVETAICEQQVKTTQEILDWQPLQTDEI
jgi:hypothetical protein